MRKCDICHTPIPIGEKYCPKCGYKMPDSLKTNQAQNQPTPQTKIKKTYIEVKKTNKRKWNATHMLVVVGFVVFMLLFSLTTIRKVMDLVGRNPSMDSFEEVEDGEFRNFEDLNLYCPTLAKETLPYYKKIKAFETSNSTLIEYYRVEDNEIDKFDITLSFESEDKKMQIGVMNTSGKVWDYRCNLELIDYKEETLKIDDFKLIADYLEIDLDTFFNQCSTLYERLLKSEEENDMESDSFGGYQIFVSKSDSVEFSVYKV